MDGRKGPASRARAIPRLGGVGGAKWPRSGLHLRMAGPGGVGCAALLAAMMAPGCDCERNRKHMEETANSGFEDAFQCCKALETIDPGEAALCYSDLKDWRSQLSTLIVLWYQACLDNNVELMKSILATAKALFASRFGDDCPAVVSAADGQLRTAGIPFTWTDLVQFDGAFERVEVALWDELVARPGLAGDDSQLFELDDGQFTATVAGATVAGALTGAVRLGPADVHGQRSVIGFTASFSLGGECISAHLDDPAALSMLTEDAGHATLGVRVSLAATEGLSLLLPPVAWIEFPVRVGGDLIELDERVWSLRSVVPPALGIADWTADGSVTSDDWDAYFSAPPGEQDVDLDGDSDGGDAALFINSYRRATIGQPHTAG